MRYAGRIYSPLRVLDVGIPLSGHIFCSQCIESWQEDFQVGEGFSTCPKCSRGFRQTDIVKLFLPPNMEESVASTSRTPVSPEGVTPEPVINDARVRDRHF